MRYSSVLFLRRSSIGITMNATTGTHSRPPAASPCCRRMRSDRPLRSRPCSSASDDQQERTRMMAQKRTRIRRTGSTPSRLACTLACLAATATMVSGLRSSRRPTADLPESASFPLVVRTRHASVTEADDVLLPLNLDLMGRGRHLAEDNNGYERDILLHSLEDWTTLREAISVGGSFSFQIDEEHTALFHRPNNEAAESEGETSDRHLGASSSSYETMQYFPCYRTVQGTYDTMYALHAQYPDLATVESIGSSYKGEDILMLRITGLESTASPIADREPAVFTSGIHAREYGPPEIATRLAELLLSQYGVDADITSVLNHTVLHLVLQSNPDSRRIAERNRADAQPRKNQRNVDGCSEAAQWGTDLNRNFDFQHGAPGASDKPCHILYHGKNGASEGETQAIQELSKRVFPDWQRKVDAEDEAFVAFPDTARGLYVDIHSYGRDIIFPYGYQNEAVGNIDAFKSISHKICSINNYDPSGSGYYFLGRTSGDTLDYHYGALGVASILYEVGNSWAESCDSFENSVFRPNLEALLYTTKLAMTPYRTSLGPDIVSMAVDASADGRLVTVSAEVSDYAMTELSGKRQLSTAVQTIQSVKAYVDSHPYDTSPHPPLLMQPSGGGSFKSHTESVVLSFDSSSMDGRHTICVVATDDDEYVGTVTCRYVNVPVTIDAVSTPGEQEGTAIADEEPATTPAINNSTNSTGNSTSSLVNETDISLPVTETDNKDDDGDDVNCSTIQSEDDCDTAAGCRWRANKNKCVGICQGRRSEQQCLKASQMCQWEPDLPKCSKK